MKSLCRLLAMAALAAALVGCAAPQTRQILHNRDAADLPAAAMNSDVPFIAQDDLYCGPASLAMALGATGDAVGQQTVAKAIYTPGREGTLRSDVLAGARRWGRLAVPVGSLSGVLREVAAGNPVIVFQNLSLPIAPQWHFAVAVGYDLDRREIILHSGTARAKRTGLSTFEHTWARGDHWALVVTAPDRIPATASETEALGAAAALERVDRLDAARTAWTAVVGRWPDSFGGHMGLGNTLYARGNYSGARAAFSKAAEIRPDAAEAWNNLAYALSALGELKAAVAAAEKAVRLGGGAPNYRDTLEEMRAAAKAAA